MSDQPPPEFRDRKQLGIEAGRFKLTGGEVIVRLKTGHAVFLGDATEALGEMASFLAKVEHRDES